MSPNRALLLGPDRAALLVRTGRTGAAAQAGHDLVLLATAWTGSATLDGEQPSITLSVPADALRVRKATGRMKPLSERDKRAITDTIADSVLKRTAIEFRSTSVTRNGADNRDLEVRGDLSLAGVSRPVGFTLHSDATGHFTARMSIRQTDWGITPYSALFGTLKVADEVEIALEPSR